MRQALIDFHAKVDADLTAIEAGIKNYLVQIELLFADNNATSRELKLKLAISCQRGLHEYKLMRDRLLAKRHLVHNISLN